MLVHNMVHKPERLLQLHPDRVPVHVNVGDGLYLDKYKYLVPRTMTVGEFGVIIRKRMNKLKPYEAIFLFVGNTLPPQPSTFSELHRQYAENNMLLNLEYRKENTFG